MTKTTVRVLAETEWSLYRDIRLRALEESPESFAATLAEESARDEQFWRERMTRSHRLLAEREGAPVGIVSVGPYEADPAAAEVFGLYVIPEARRKGVSWSLVEAAAAVARGDDHEQLYYWAGTDNARAIGFANNFGFRAAGLRRPARAADLERGDEEIAMVLWVAQDENSVPNPMSGTAVTREGPIA